MHSKSAFIIALLVLLGFYSTFSTPALFGQAPAKTNQESGGQIEDSNRAQLEAKKPVPATIEQAAWIAGSWAGEAMGGEFEETWSAPSGGAMMGMFKFMEKGEIRFYEILTIVPKNNSLLLRLKHFDKDLNGWEEKDQSVEFPLVSVKPDELKFDGLTFSRISNDEMHIVVVIGGKDSTKKVKFVCKRKK